MTISDKTHITLPVLLTALGIAATAGAAHWRIAALESRQDKHEVAESKHADQDKATALDLQRLQDGVSRVSEVLTDLRDEVRALRKGR